MKRFEFENAMFREMIRLGVSEKEARRTYKKIMARRIRKESVGDPYQISLMEKLPVNSIKSVPWVKCLILLQIN